MNTPQQNLSGNLSGKLLDLEPPTPLDRAEYQRALQGLFDRKLTPADWLRIGAMGLGGLAGALVCGSLAITEPGSTPARTRIALAILGLIGMTWAALAGVIVRRGSIHSAVHGTLAARLGFAFSLAAAIGIACMSLSNPRATASPALMLLPIATLTLATAVLIVHELRQSELRLRQKILESEYRLGHSR